MKKLIVSLFLALAFTQSASAHAYISSEFKDVQESDCPGLKEIKNLVALCTGVKHAGRIYAASSKTALKLENIPDGVDFRDVVELGIWPDDSTSMMYLFSSLLRNEDKKPVGYRVFHAYHNSEMESTIKVESRFNLDGKLVSIELYP